MPAPGVGDVQRAHVACRDAPSRALRFGSGLDFVLPWARRSQVRHEGWRLFLPPPFVAGELAAAELPADFVSRPHQSVVARSSDRTVDYRTLPGRRHDRGMSPVLYSCYWHA